MSKGTIAAEITDYLINSGEDVNEWSVECIAEQLSSKGYGSIDEVDPDCFIETLEEWGGCVGDSDGKPVDFEQAMALADRDVCEALHAEGIESRQEFFDRYAEEHAAKFDGEEFAPYYGLAW